MEQTNVNACKFVLATYEQGGNHYYDTTFNLRVPFKQNSNGVYKITINEICFRNNEATLVKDEDYFDLKIYVTGEDNPRIIRFTMARDIFNYQAGTEEYILKTLRISDDYNDGDAEDTYTVWEVLNWPNDPDTGDLGDYGIHEIGVVYLDEVNETIKRYEGSKTFMQRMGLQVVFEDAAWVSNIWKVELSYTDNWAYVFNNMNLVVTAEPTEVTYTGVANTYDGYTFWFYNMRINGPYIYVVDTPLTATVNTYNANNQGYNIVALSYNDAPTHNVCIKMCSSMECTTNDLSNFRVRLLDDQFNPVRVYQPMYIQITISNEG